MSLEERKKASLGKDRMLLCRYCLIEQEVYSAAGHKENEMNLHCVRCTRFVARLFKNGLGSWELDPTVYGIY